MSIYGRVFQNRLNLVEGMLKYEETLSGPISRSKGLNIYEIRTESQGNIILLHFISKMEYINDQCKEFNPQFWYSCIV